MPFISDFTRIYTGLPMPSLDASHYTSYNNNFKYLHLASYIDCYKLSFFLRAILEWNNLPSYVARYNYCDLINTRHAHFLRDLYISIV